MAEERAWVVREVSSLELCDKFVSALGVSPVTAACLVHRELSTVDSARRFLNPKLKWLRPPDGMADLVRGGKRVAKAIANQETIGIFGDYDVDGLTSTALIYTFLRTLRANVEVRIANRFRGGYGLDPSVVDEFADAGCAVLIAMDCGTSDHLAMGRAKTRGLHSIVVDHHRIEGNYPDAYAFINPQRTDCQFGDRTLCAVGVTFYLCAVVRKELITMGVDLAAEVDIRRYLDFVAMGTIADVVPLGENNRILVSHGLKIMSRYRRPGLAALIDSVRIRARNITSGHISYQLGPRINAAGRLSDAMEAFELLVATVTSDAMELASVLERLTVERREIEGTVAAEARAQLAKMEGEKQAVVVYGDGWHKGVLGIVAARLCEEVACPVFVVGFDEDGVGTGSARGQGQMNLFECLESARAHLVRFGGHQDAAGFSVKRDQLDALILSINQFAQTHYRKTDAGTVWCDARLKPADVTFDLYQQIQRLGPFGITNPEPLFLIEGLDVLSARVVGGCHLKLQLKTPTGQVAAFGPGLGVLVDQLPQCVDVVASLAEDEWRGDGTVELKLTAAPQAHGTRR